MVWLIGFGLRDFVGKQKNFRVNKEYGNPTFLNVETLLMVAPKYIIHSIF